MAYSYLTWDAELDGRMPAFTSTRPDPEYGRNMIDEIMDSHTAEFHLVEDCKSDVMLTREWFDRTSREPAPCLKRRAVHGVSPEQGTVLQCSSVGPYLLSS